MKKKMSLLLAIAMVLTVVFGFAGCSSSKEILLWHPLGGLDGEFFEAMVKAYNDTDPEYPVKSVVQADQYTKIYTMMGSNSKDEIPDLVVYHAERIEVFKSQGFLDPMDDIIAYQPNINGDNYIEAAWNPGEVDGNRYAVPLDTHSSLLIYNKDLAEKYAPGVMDDGILTFDEMYEVQKNIGDDPYIVYGMNLRAWLVKTLITEQGGKINDGDTPVLNTPEAEKAYETLRSLVNDGISQQDGDDPLALFQTGECIFYQGATWDAGALNEIDGLNWSFATSPAFDTTGLSNWTSSHQFGTLKKERSDEVEQGIASFLEFVRTHPEMWAAAGQNPASKDFIDSGMYKDYPQAILMDDPKTRDSLTIYDFLYTNEAQSALETVTDDIIFSRIEIKEGLEKAQKEVEDKIAQAIN